MSIVYEMCDESKKNGLCRFHDLKPNRLLDPTAKVPLFVVIESSI